MANVVYRCQSCDYVHERPAKPKTCPQCGAHYNRFLEVRLEKKKDKEKPPDSSELPDPPKAP